MYLTLHYVAACDEIALSEGRMGEGASREMEGGGGGGREEGKGGKRRGEGGERRGEGGERREKGERGGG